ncbi:MAG: MmgE/PrpD family protein [Actinobacteria bacterium]|nr:MmgE/PrpD family protein [Actinomycetota bacterium]
MTTLLERLGRFAADSIHRPLPADVAASVPGRVLDILGICVRATEVDSTDVIRTFIQRQRGSGRCTAVGFASGMPATTAAFVNGVLAHSLDYDDTHLPSILHPSASVVPAVLAAAEEYDCAPHDVMNAVAIGLELVVRLGMAGYDQATQQSEFFEHGWHATSMCGAIGAAGAVAALARGTAEECAHAMAVACSMASGIIEANRTGGTVKRIHCGWAAQAAVTAAQLAVAGLTGAPTALEGRFGFYGATLRDKWSPDPLLDGLGTEWNVADIFYKPYPANHFTHAGIDAAIALRSQGLRSEQVASATLAVATATVRTIGDPIDVKRSPPTGYAAQFSGPYTVAAALIGGGGLGLGLDDFTDALANDPRRRELMKKITVVGDAACDAVYPYEFPAVLTVDTIDGRELKCAVMENRGGPRRPLSHAELRGKFDQNVDGLLKPEAATLVADVLTSATPDVRAVMTHLGSIGSARE